MFTLIKSIVANLNELVRLGYDSVPECFRKYPLKDSWSLWVFTPNAQQSWHQNQNLVTTFSTVDDYWSLFSTIKLPSEMPSGLTCSLFRERILPMWEDDCNLTGGRWVLTIRRDDSCEINSCWNNTVLSLISEAFESYGLVCGAVISFHQRNVRISLWVGEGCSTYVILEIGRIFKRNLKLCECCKIHYKRHSDCIKHGSSMAAAFMEI